ncbi:polysaccharide biosynthesis C-terminal domain-containing protein [Providencia rettgeri]|uniref:oligosaccharide flippase family protein n=1 Tax=Providencia rettgeri TaxID=587 RepID=UPI0018E454D5|nr:polysaccharide biosynthesis C-terminal domain-containing protein [Providencia rettgeri]MBI6203895.1 polysaccharide biosynthesis C-terminal domain-containing protein [Providencia rettgeri]HEP0308243.1 polysaccharide biosynthesis C-terminal domain-containing protein [Providencia rettgeri]
MNHSLLRKIHSIFNNSELLKGSLKVFIYKILSSFIALILSAYITRNYGGAIAGVYFFITGAVLFLSTICTLGFQSTVLKNTSIKNNADGNAYFIKSLSIVIIFTTAVGLLGWLYGNILGYTHNIFKTYYPFVFISILPFSLLLIYSNYFQARQQFFNSILALTMGHQTILLILFLFIDNFSSYIVLKYYVFSLFLTLFILSFKAFYNYKTSSIKKVESVKVILYSSFPILVTQVIGQVNVFSGQFILSNYVSSEYLAYYAVSIRICVIMSFFIIAVNKVVASKFAKYHANNQHDKLISSVKSANRLLWIVSLPMLLIIVLFSKQLLNLFGHEFSDYYLVLIIVASGQFIASVTGTVIFLLQMTGLQKQLMVNIIISVSFSLIIGIFLVHYYGLYGAAWMTFISLATTNLLGCITAYKKLKINPFSIF